MALTETSHLRMRRLFEASLETAAFDGDPDATTAAVNAEIGRQLAAVERLYADYRERLRLPLADCPPAVVQAQLAAELASVAAEKLIAAHGDGEGPPAWSSALASSLEALGRHDWALACRERAARLAPDRPALRLDLIEALQARGQHDRAARHAEALVGKWPDDARVRLAGIRAAVLAGTEADPAGRYAALLDPASQDGEEQDEQEQAERQLSPRALLTLARAMLERDHPGLPAKTRCDLRDATAALVQREPGLPEAHLAHGYAALGLGDRAAAQRSFAVASLMARDGVVPSQAGHEGTDALAFARAFLVDPAEPAARGRPVWRADDRLVGLAEILELQQQGDPLVVLSRADAVVGSFVVATPLSFERYKSYKIVRFNSSFFGIPEHVRDFHFVNGVVCRIPGHGGRSRYAIPRWIAVIARRVIPVARRFDRHGRLEASARRLARRVVVATTAVPGVKAASTRQELLALIDSAPKL